MLNSIEIHSPKTLFPFLIIKPHEKSTTAEVTIKIIILYMETFEGN